MFSEALKIMDRNTVNYMIEEQQKELEEKDKQLQEKDQEILALKKQLEELQSKG